MVTHPEVPAGDLVARGHTPTAALSPGLLSVTPDEQILVAANQKSGTLVSFWLDMETGSLDRTGHEIQAPTPVSVAFMPAPVPAPVAVPAKRQDESGQEGGTF